MRRTRTMAELLLDAGQADGEADGGLASDSQALIASLFGLQLAQRRVTSDLQQQTGLSESDLIALGVLLGRPPSPVKELSEELGLTAGSTSTLVDRLTRAGMVDRTTSRTDRRVALVTITEHGAALMGGARARYLNAIGRALETCTGHCLETATHVLDGVAAGLNEAPRGAARVVDHDPEAVRHIVESIRLAPSAAIGAS